MVDALKKGDIDWTPLYKVIEESSTMQRGVLAFHGLLRTLNVPTPYPDAVQCVGTLAVAVATLILYYLFFGKRHVKRRKDLLQELAIAQEKLHELEVQLAEAEHEDVSDEEDQERKEKRVFLEGAFDLMHYGHMNAFRQARAWGTTLIVGVNDDASIEKCKGTAPIMNNEERMVMVESCKWVDETILGVPYIMTAEYLDKIVREYKIDYVVHGDDPCIVDGKDVYELPKRLGMFRSIPRTEGVSTTDIVGRMLYLTREHHDHTYKAKRRKDSIGSTDSASASDLLSRQKQSPEIFNRASQFLTTTRLLRIFSAGQKEPPPNAKIVYIQGAFDMLHIGHVKTLKRAKELGDYLIVGVHNDNAVNRVRGANYPIMNLNERVLSVLGCRYVDDVLIDAPWIITRDMIASLNISLIVTGTVADTEFPNREKDPYQVAKDLGIFQNIKSESNVTVGSIVQRVVDNESVFKKKVEKKMRAEREYYSSRYGYNKN